MDFKTTLIGHDCKGYEQLKEWLGNWSYLSMAMKENAFSEAELLSMIKFELMNKNRIQILMRLKTRYNKLRAQRELDELKELRITYARKNN